MRCTATLILLMFMYCGPALAAGGWTAREVEEPYAISGTTGIDLYRSIGERGPMVGTTRAIAVTTFKLTWRRDYQPRDGGCTLVSVRPNLTIIYKLPRPSQRLSPPLAQAWETFLNGMRVHERVHGETILDMVHEIEAVSVGLHVPGDTACRRIREELTAKLGALSQKQRQRGRDFDLVEMSPGGNVHRLILDLVNVP
ncbi:DUF922 domain-containing Zn-dependent protease [Aureimonas frigidaquae]|uniref:Secreted Zn-dependent protease n=1 Tax=Aureimonas frigidaquae TaxID=424757 RepID=A0A0N7KXY3_9HYPH|nr:DUF922 domain-containing protein [Aureimonas frigidaquae]BAT28201.1 hypothetical protein [Aureimonas frigidaquae]